MSGILYNAANALVRIHVGLNLGYPAVYVPQRVVVAQPAPAVCEQPATDDDNVSYNEDADDYYYLPEADAYYSVSNRCYYYNNGDAWVSATYLPGAYRDYNWRSMRHYEVRAARPYMHADFYRARFNGAAFNGRWNRNVYDNRYRQVEYNRNRVAYDAQRFNHNEFRGHDDFRRDGFRHGR